MTEGFADLLDNMTKVLEAVTGYKAQCERAGFSPTASEHMALTLHEHLQEKIWNGKPGAES